ncbi:MAG: hypothetical protein AB7G13_00640 [Lautropia sp.]
MTSAADSPFQDLYLLTLARHIRDDDIVHVGGGQADVRAAAEVARLLWAPAVRMIVFGTYFLGRARHPELMAERTYSRLARSSYPVLNQTNVFDDLSRGRVAFPGGMQIDQRGNGNLIGVLSGSGKYIRGPGSGGLTTLTSQTDRFFFAVARHTPALFVPRVHRISVLGDPVARAAMGLPCPGLHEVVTPLASFRPSAEGLRLVSVSPGVSAADAQRGTGFPVDLDPAFAERVAPSSEEQAALRHVRAMMKRKESA